MFCSLPVRQEDSGEGRKTPLEITAAGTVADFHGIPLLIHAGISGFRNQRHGKCKKN